MAKWALLPWKPLEAVATSGTPNLPAWKWLHQPLWKQALNQVQISDPYSISQLTSGECRFAWHSKVTSPRHFHRNAQGDLHCPVTFKAGEMTGLTF